MKRLLLLIPLLWIIILHSLSARAGQITHTVSYDPSKLSIVYDTINGNVYAKINYGEVISFGSEGFPLLPFDALTLSVPYNSTNFNVQIDSISYIDIKINAPVFPCQKDRIISDTTSFVFTNTNDSVYNLHSFFPTKQLSIISYGNLLGDNKVVNIGLIPISYSPYYSKIRIIISAKIILSYDIDNNTKPLFYRLNPDIKEKGINLVSKLVANSSAVRANSFYSPHSDYSKTPSSSPALPTFNYCIITSKKLEPAFKKIIAMKRQKGLSAGTICVEDLMESSICNEGDKNYDNLGNIISTLADSAGVVRQYLKYAYKYPDNPTQYVLMGGNAPNAPIRFVKSNGDITPNKNHVATDMYFSDMDQVWEYYPSSYNNEYTFRNADNNNKSFLPDVFVGRILCNNHDEIDNYSNKLHQYVFNPGNGDTYYLKNALVASIYSFRYNAYNLINNLDSIFHNHITYFDGNGTQIYPTGKNVIDEINNTGFGYISLYGHGEPQAIQVYNKNNIINVITASDSNPSVTTNNVNEEIGNGLDCLNNKYDPSILYSISCVTMPYDKAASFCTMTTFENKCNLGEAFTLGKNYGGVAFLGNTRRGYLTTSSNLENYFVGKLNNGIYSVGMAEAFSKIFVSLNSDIGLHVTTEHNLLGDPEFEMWTNEPLEYQNITVERTQLGFIVHGITENDTLAYCDNDGHQGRITTHDDFAYLMDISPNSSVMIYNHDHIPYLIPLILQNCDINNSQYVYASSFGAGKSVVPNLTNGNVLIKNGAIYEVDATADVSLGTGFIVEDGATFNVKTPGKVTIDGCVFQSGSNVKIEAGKIEIVKSFKAECGAKVEINNYIE